MGEVTEDFSAELMANGLFSECIRKWKQSYDFIVLDCPPILPAADARIMAEHADASLLVVKARHDIRAETCEAYHQLSETSSELTGVILIGDRTTSRYGYGRDGYGYGYGYGYESRTSDDPSVPAGGTAVA
jgi:succinoglycan biosynthesis transport protein ExoP